LKLGTRFAIQAHEQTLAENTEKRAHPIQLSQRHNQLPGDASRRPKRFSALALFATPPSSGATTGSLTSTRHADPRV
jgi:hypothetical protein